jgi:hypothetical protein
MLGHGLLEGIVESPYPETPPRLIGSVYFAEVGTVEISANAGFWADGYANFRFAGMFGATLVAGLFFWLFDSVAAGNRWKIGATLAALPAYKLANSALLTTMFTHGLGLLVIALYLMPFVRSTDEDPSTQ